MLVALIAAHHSLSTSNTMPNSQTSTGKRKRPPRSEKSTASRDTPYQYRPKPDKPDGNQKDVDPATVTCQSSEWGDATQECSREDRERLYNTINIRKVVDAMASALDQLTLAQTTNLPEASEAISHAMEGHKRELTKTIEGRPDWNTLLQIPPDQHPSSFIISAWAHPATASHCPDSVAMLLHAVPIGSANHVGPLLCSIAVANN
jgi:hypothetical protein